MQTDSQTLRDKNLKVFAERLPDIHARLAAITAPISKPVFENGVAVDIDLGSGRLYKDDGRKVGVEQAEAFLDSPSWAGYNNVEGVTGDSIIARRFYVSLLDILKKMGIDAMDKRPTGRVGFGFVFGIGLGHHLPVLAEGLDVANLVVCEVLDEFVLHSLSAIDWGALFETVEGRGGQLHVVLDAKPESVQRQVFNIVDRVGEMLLDGAQYYRHYPFWSLDEAYRRVLDDTPIKMAGRGYYEDERKMLRNCATCVHKFDHYLIKAGFRQRWDTPAFMVASGPSVDYDMEYIKKWRDHAIVFSGGTSLEVLLAAGIVPDYHVELENVTAVYDMSIHILERYKHLFPEGRFTGLKFITSSTVNPRVPPLFDEVYFFFRDSVVSSQCYSKGEPHVSGIGPSISNTMMAVAARLGFEDMYLFGHDCGWREEGEHHAKNTIYYTAKQFETAKMSGEYSYPGNFGGTIHGNLIFSWTRDMLQQKIEKYQLKVFNCSDGAFLKGSSPKLAETLFFPGKPLDKQAVFDRIRNESVFQKAGEYMVDIDHQALLDENKALRQAFEDLIEQALSADVDMLGFIDPLMVFDREGRKGKYMRVFPLYQGSIIGFVKAACYYVNRVQEDQRIPLMREFLVLYRDLHRDMFDEGDAMFTEIRDWIAGGPEPWWTDGLPTTPGTTY